MTDIEKARLRRRDIVTRCVKREEGVKMRGRALQQGNAAPSRPEKLPLTVIRGQARSPNESAASTSFIVLGGGRWLRNGHLGRRWIQRRDEARSGSVLGDRVSPHFGGASAISTDTDHSATPQQLSSGKM